MTKIPFVYLTSPPFSGSTLFSFLVNTHPQITTVGEMMISVKSDDPASYLCSCGLKMRDCRFWQLVTERMTSRQFSFDPLSFENSIQLGNSYLARRVLNGSIGIQALDELRDHMLRFWPSQQQRLDYLLARNKALAASILQVTGKNVFFDASKNPTVIRRLDRDPDIDLRVVHLVRDVRGASLSRRKNKGEKNWRNSVKKWIRTNQKIERQLNRFAPDKWIRLRYEDVCKHPTETLNRFFAFCGLEPHDLRADFNSVEHHIIGNRMRLRNVGQIRLDENWRNVLTADEQDCALKLAGSMHTRYGYGNADKSEGQPVQGD